MKKLSLAQWNLAGINNNALEFGSGSSGTARGAPSSVKREDVREALLFKQELDALVMNFVEPGALTTGKKMVSRGAQAFVNRAQMLSGEELLAKGLAKHQGEPRHKVTCSFRRCEGSESGGRGEKGEGGEGGFAVRLVRSGG